MWYWLKRETVQFRAYGILEVKGDGSGPKTHSKWHHTQCLELSPTKIALTTKFGASGVVQIPAHLLMFWGQAFLELMSSLPMHDVHREILTRKVFSSIKEAHSLDQRLLGEEPDTS